MPGIFKKLSANDIKITPFEAHKQYDTTDLASIGASTASLAWSGKNKSTFSSGSLKYYQIDKLYYRNYIQERANRLELDDAAYTTQERRLYQSASLLSLSQKTFGSEVQPESLILKVSKSGDPGDGIYNIADDGFGNLYDTDLGKNNFPNEDQRVLYIAPVNGFKRSDLTINYETGNEYVNSPFENGYSRTVYDDSYFQNIVTYENIEFNNTNNFYNTTGIKHSGNTNSRVRIQNKPYLNFNDEDFCISFYYNASVGTNSYSTTDQPKTFILTKEGAQNSPPLGTQAGGGFSTRASGALDITSTPSNPAYPYKVYIERPTALVLEIYLERFDGETTSLVSGSFYNLSDGLGLKHILLQKTGSKLQAYFQGQLENEEDDLTTKPCQNNADLLLFSKLNPDGSYKGNSEDGANTDADIIQPTQFQIWNRAMSSNEIAMISESFTGTYPVGNIFYDNGFVNITHPKYMEIFNGGTLQTLKYKNTHLITENEYQCTMTEDEFEFTTNLSARKIPFSKEEELANFATGSQFKPYVSSVGLYDDEGNCLVIGKLGQPIKASSETDTTFVIRFDT